MDKELEKEITDALSTTTEDLDFEEPLSPVDSPLNLPVVEDEIGHGKKTDTKEEMASPPELKVETQEPEKKVDSPKEKVVHDESEELDFDQNSEVVDAPEQVIGKEEAPQYDEPINEFQMPEDHAEQMAKTLLGVSNNVLHMAGSFVVKMKKPEEFYEFDEVIELIDEQNEKNLAKVTLDKEDQELLQPLLKTVIQRQATQISPEKQLMGAVLSILVKKGQNMLEIRAENEILTERFLSIMKEEKDQEQDGDEQELDKDSEPSEVTEKPENGLDSDKVLEVAED